MSVEMIAVGVIVGVCLILCAFASVWLLVAAFRAHWGWGIAVLVTGGVGALLFSIFNWDKAKKPLFATVLSGMLCYGGLFYLMSSYIETVVDDEELQAVLEENMKLIDLSGDSEDFDLAMDTLAASDAPGTWDEEEEEPAQPPLTEVPVVASDAPDKPVVTPKKNASLAVSTSAVAQEYLDLVGKPIREVKRRYGNPMGTYRGKDGLVLLYTHAEFISRDDKMITAVRKTE